MLTFELQRFQTWRKKQLSSWIKKTCLFYRKSIPLEAHKRRATLEVKRIKYTIFVSGLCTEDFMAKLGEYLILTAFSHNCRIERAYKCLGTNLTEFLTTLDSVHDVLHDQVNHIIVKTYLLIKN